MTRASDTDVALAIRLLTALAGADNADQYAEARRELIRVGGDPSNGLRWGVDPFAGVPCPAEDRASGLGLTIGCPSTKAPDGSRVHTDGHPLFRLTARVMHCDRIARARLDEKKGTRRG